VEIPDSDAACFSVFPALCIRERHEFTVLVKFTSDIATVHNP